MLAHAKTDDELRDVVDRLWADGGQRSRTATSRTPSRRCAHAQEALRQALERGASDEELKKLMDQLRAALDKFMQALAEEMRKNPQACAPARPQYARAASAGSARACSTGWRTWRAPAPRMRRAQLLEQLQ